MLLLFISVKKIFENMPFKGPILLILGLPKMPGLELGAPDTTFLFINNFCKEEIFT